MAELPCRCVTLVSRDIAERGGGGDQFGAGHAAFGAGKGKAFQEAEHAPRAGCQAGAGGDPPDG